MGSHRNTTKANRQTGLAFGFIQCRVPSSMPLLMGFGVGSLCSGFCDGPSAIPYSSTRTMNDNLPEVIVVLDLFKFEEGSVFWLNRGYLP
ncbi:MAG: hypothetical protein U0Z75_05495 [Deinococcaceae bacterium]